MKKRLLATLVLWALILVPPYLLGNVGAFILIGLFAMGSFYEFLDLMNRAGRPVDRVVSMVAFVMLLLGFMVFPPVQMVPFAIISTVFVFTMVACLLNSDIGVFSATASPTVGSVFILGIPYAAVILLVHDFGLVTTVWVIAVAKFADVGALLTGMSIGRHRMAPAYSPNKTWEGLAGGIVVSVLVSIGYVAWLGEYLPSELTLAWAAVLALLITLSGVLSDLVESAFKREAKVKDSGALIPGIGGILDLTDTVILAFPVAYTCIWLLI